MCLLYGRHSENGKLKWGRQGQRPESANTSILASGNHRNYRQRTLSLCFAGNQIEVIQHFLNAHCVDLSLRIEARLNELLQVVACYLSCQIVGNGFAGALFLLNPCERRKSNPHRTAIDVETDVDGVSVTGSDRDYVGLPSAMQVFAAPAVDNVKIFVHANSVNGSGEVGKLGNSQQAGSS